MPQSNSNRDSSSNRDTPTITTGEDKQESNMVQGLSDTAQTIGASLQAMQTVLVGNMQQAAQMTLSMNNMMEELVKRSVQVSVFAHKPSDFADTRGYRINLQISVSNKSPIPLQNAHIRLWFCPRQELYKKGVNMVSKQKDDSHMVFEQSVAQLPDKFEDALPFIQTVDGFCVASGATTETELELDIDVLHQLNGRISLEFSSPGTGHQLSVSHRFGIHLLQLVECFFVRDQSALEEAGLAVVPDSLSVKVDLARMRSLFRVPPADGVGIGCLLCVRTHEILLGLRVIAVVENARTASCEWLATTAATSAKQELIQHLTEELSTHDNTSDSISL